MHPQTHVIFSCYFTLKHISSSLKLFLISHPPSLEFLIRKIKIFVLQTQCHWVCNEVKISQWKMRPVINVIGIMELKILGEDKNNKYLKQCIQ